MRSDRFDRSFYFSCKSQVSFVGKRAVLVIGLVQKTCRMSEPANFSDSARGAILSNTLEV